MSLRIWPEPHRWRIMVQHMKVAHIADLHLGVDRSLELFQMERLSKTLDRIEPDLILIGGDVVDRASEESFIWASQCLDLFSQPIKVVPGNWDCLPEADDPYALYKKYFGPPYYSFDIAGVHFVALDTAGNGVKDLPHYQLGDQQFRWLTEDLAGLAKQCNSIVIFTHAPWQHLESQTQKQLKRICQDYPVRLYLTAHDHVNHCTSVGNMDCYITPPALPLPKPIDPAMVRLLTYTNNRWNEKPIPTGLVRTEIRPNGQPFNGIVDDFHVHTNYNNPANPKMKPDVICQHAAELGFKRIGFADYLCKHTSYRDVLKLRTLVRAVRIKTVEAFFGVEVELAASNSTTLPRQWRSTFDYVILALDHADGPAALPIPSPEDIAGWIGRYQTGCKVASSTGVEILAHPFSACPEALETVDQAQLTQMLETLAKGGVALELNALKLARDGGRAGFQRMYRLASDLGLKFALGSDAHRWGELGGTGQLVPLLKKLKIDDSMLWRPEKRS